MFYYYDPTYWLIILGAIVALYAQIKVSTTYSKWSKVPSSRSRAMERAPDSTDPMRASTAIRPGTMNQRVMRLGLNQARDSISTGGAAAFLARSSAPKLEAICWA